MIRANNGKSSTTHHCNLGAATPLIHDTDLATHAVAVPRNPDAAWCSHSTMICKHWVGKHHRRTQREHKLLFQTNCRRPRLRNMNAEALFTISFEKENDYPTPETRKTPKTYQHHNLRATTQLWFTTTQSFNTQYIEWRNKPRHPGTLMWPLHGHLRRQTCKTVQNHKTDLIQSHPDAAVPMHKVTLL